MIDHILNFQDVSSCPFEVQNSISWTKNLQTYMPVKVVIQDAIINSNNEITTSEILAPGYWIVVRSNVRSARIESIPGHCLTTDSVLASENKPFVYVSKFQPTTVLGRITPVFSGDSYPFPSGPASNLEQYLIE